MDGLVHVALDPAGLRADGLALRLADFELHFEPGTLFVSPAPLGPTVLVFIGEATSASRLRRRSTSSCASSVPAPMDERVRRSSSASTRPTAIGPCSRAPRAGPGGLRPLARGPALLQLAGRQSFVLDAPLPRSPWWLLPTVGDALVAFHSRRGTLTFTLNEGDPEDVSFFNRDKRLQILLYASGGRESDYDEDGRRAVDVVSHDLSVRFEPDRSFIRGEDTLSLELLQPSTSLRLRLDDALRVLAVTSPEGGSHIFFRVRGQNSVVVSLGPYSGRVGEARLLVRYVGALSPSPVEDDSLQAQVEERRSGLDDDEIFIEKVFLYTNKNAWYPRNLSDDHARFRARFDVPAGLTAVTGGRLEASATAGDRTTFDYHLDEPGKYLSVILGRPGSGGPAAARPAHPGRLRRPPATERGRRGTGRGPGDRRLLSGRVRAQPLFLHQSRLHGAPHPGRPQPAGHGPPAAAPGARPAPA